MKRRDGEAKTPRLQEDAAHAMEKETSGQTMPKQTTDVDRLVGIRITALRKARGMSQTALGNAVGVTFQQVQKYEKGANRVGAGRLTRIAGVLEVPVSTFFGGPDGPESLPAAGVELEYLAQPGALRLLRAYSQIRMAPLQRSIVALVEKIAVAAEGHGDGRT